LRHGERGAALLVVLIALAALMPLALLLSDFASRRQRQVTGYRFNLAGQAAVRGALDLAVGRLEEGRIALVGPDQSAQFELEEPANRPVTVRVRRQGDAVLTLEGDVLDAEDAAGLDLDSVALDGLGGLVRRYRRLEVYLVEAEAPARYPYAAVRLLAVVARPETEPFVVLGLRYDRGYFP
jgi:hypothetical protein